MLHRGSRDTSASDWAGWMLVSGSGVLPSCRKASTSGMIWCLPGVHLVWEDLALV